MYKNQKGRKANPNQKQSSGQYQQANENDYKNHYDD